MRRKIPASIRRFVMERALNFCEYCKAPEEFSLDSFTIDHIVPTSAEGSDHPDNLAYACWNCNNRKQDDTSAIDPETGQKVELYNPRNDLWQNHFKWADDKATIQPLTSIGRATISKLHINRSGAVNVRRAAANIPTDREFIPEN